tara:strand:+ start:1723 stop:2385 length:663 start_codon:yes stop_codon:yes gene_type:complete
MIIEFLFIIIMLYFYFLLYIDNKINKNNDFYFIDTVSNRKINNEIYLKMPFYFSAKHLNKKIELDKFNIIENNKNYNKYNKTYEKIHLIEPYINYTVTNNIVELKPSKNYIIHENYESINYYFVKEGNVKISLIHPMFKDNFYINNNILNNKKIINYIKNNNNFRVLGCKKDTMIYVPNKWIVYIENLDKNDNSIIEIINYKTIINKLMSYTEKYLIKNN